MKNYTTEQKIIFHLADSGVLTNVTLVAPALQDPKIAEEIFKYNDDPIIPDDPESSECDHESLSNDEIQVVFDNDEE